MRLVKLYIHPRYTPRCKFENIICIESKEMIHYIWVILYLFEVDGYFDIMNITIIYITTFKGAWTVSDITTGYLTTKIQLLSH